MIVDTRDMRRALSATSRLSLAYMTSLYDDAAPWKEDENDDSKGLVFTANETDLKRYNAQDCIETARIRAAMKAERAWSTARVQALYEQHEALSKIAAKMYNTGIYVDAAKRAELATLLEAEYDKREKEFLAHVGISAMRCTPNDMRALIYKRHETAEVARFSLPDPLDKKMWAKNGQGTTCGVDKKQLARLAADGACPASLKEIIKLYWRAEAPWKARSTFVVSELIDQAIGPDGRLRAGWNSAGTDTGRIACGKPNLLNIPKAKEEVSKSGALPNLRAMYAAEPGNVLVGADWQSQEIWMAYLISGDEALGAGLRAGDVYSAAVRKVFNLPADCDVKKLHKSLRQMWKVVHLASQYGAGTNTVYSSFLLEGIEKKYAEVAALHRTWKQQYTGIVAYWEAEMKRVAACGYSESRIMGRRRVYSSAPELSETVNYPVQSTAADWSNCTVIELAAALDLVPGARLIVNQYDAFYVECLERDTEVIKRVLTDVMCKPRQVEGKWQSIPIDIDVGRTWADA